MYTNHRIAVQRSVAPQFNVPINRLQTCNKRVWRRSEAELTVLTPLSDKRVVVTEDVTFECVFSKPDKPATWSKQDKPISASDHVQIGVDGARHFLTIKSAVLDDDATYKIQVETAVSSGKLTVEGQSSSSSRMRVIYHNWSAMKQRPHPQSVAEISHHSVLSGDRIRQCETSSGSRHKDTDQCL